MRAAIKAVQSRADFFDDKTASFFGVSLDRKDETEKRVADRYPGHRYFGTSTARSAASTARCRLMPSPASSRSGGYGSCSTRRCASSR